MRFTDKTVLIAGASTGIGRAVALQLAAKGHNRLVVTARRQHLLGELANEVEALGSECLALASDALDAGQAATVVKQAVEHFGGIDVALLNIGDGPALNMAAIDVETVRANTALNYDTLVNYLLPVLEQMKLQQHGLVAHTNSLAGFLGLPQQGPYSAAKAAGRLLMDTCRIELQPYHIKFTSLYPGFVATERVADDGIPAPMEISAEKAAAYMIRGMEKERRDYLFPLSTAMLIRLARVLPKPVVGHLTKRMMTDDD